MKIFNHKNPRHIQILKEELARAKKILNEEYSADRVWDAMSEDEQWEVIGATSDDDGPDLADKWAGAKWDEIPADIQDMINLSDYELAIDDKFGRSLLRGIKNALDTNPTAKTFVDKFLQTIGRASIDNITVDQATKLNKGIYQFLGQGVIGTQTTSTYNPREIPSGAPSKNKDWRGGMWTGD